MVRITAALVIVFVSAATCCFRISWWHRQEADYCDSVAAQLLLFTDTTDYHRQVLIWMRANPPSIYEMVAGWYPPPERMARAGVSLPHG